MFDLGSKIILISSSHGKSTGPRRGSTGYFSQRLASRVFLDYSVCAFFGDVFFTRYGFEKKRRMERKQIINIFPIIKRGIGEDIEQQVINTANKLTSEKNNEIQEIIRGYLEAPPTTPIVMASSHGCSESMLEGNRTEVRAWVESVLSNQDFCLFLHSAINSGHYRNASVLELRAQQTWERIRVMSMDRNFRRSVLDGWVKDPELLSSAITLLRSIIIMMERKRILGVINNTRHSFLGLNLEKPIDPELSYGVFLEHIFNPALHRTVWDLAIATKSSNLMKFLEDIKSVSGELGVLSARLGAGVSE